MRLASRLWLGLRLYFKGGNLSKLSDYDQGNDFALHFV
jgi:hypothetical protein